MIREFVSFPKSGRTWIRYLLGQLGVDREIAFHHDRFEFNDGAKPPHDFDLAARLAHYRNVDRLVYLERDPRDVMVSLYHQVTGRFREFFAYDGTLSQFIRDDYFGATNLERFRRMWHAIARERAFPIVTYEACHADPAAIVRRIVDYYGFDVDDAAIARAVAASSFERMKEVEAADDFPEPWLRPKSGFPKVREGKVGGFRSVLAHEDIAYLDAIFGTRD
ncbi:MAG: sulfotransferase domain-containing protein [Rhodanobacteraceae bacterium]